MKKWVLGVLVALNLLLVLLVSDWSPPNKLDVDGGQGRLPRVANLKLDQEASPRSKPGAEVDETDSPADSGSAGESRFCGRIEGFGAEDEAIAFRDAHSGWMKKVRVARSANALPAYHWVLIPPRKSREAALKRLEELQRGGVDSFLVTEGEYKNAISLGLFESEKLAQDLNARFQSRNIETVLVNAGRNQISYALVFEVASEADFDQLKQVARREAGDLKSVENATCEGVASLD